MAAFTIVVALGFHLRVLMYEEPTLDTLFGEAWRGSATTLVASVATKTFLRRGSRMVVAAVAKRWLRRRYMAGFLHE